MATEPLEIIGRVEAVLIGSVPGNFITSQVEKLKMFVGLGIQGDGHAGRRLSDVREKELEDFGLPRGIEIANHRHWSAVSVEELRATQSIMGLPGDIPYGSLGENLVVSGIPRFTELPSGTLLFFRKPRKRDRTAVLAVWAENDPCYLPGEVIQKLFPDTSPTPKQFIAAARGRRGLVGSVYSTGVIEAGDEILVKVPRQRIYEV